MRYPTLRRCLISLKALAIVSMVVAITLTVLLIIGPPPDARYCYELLLLEGAAREGQNAWPSDHNKLSDDTAEAIRLFLSRTSEEMILALPEEYQDSARNIETTARHIHKLSFPVTILRMYPVFVDGIVMEIETLDEFCSQR